jgi:threonine/homoserine/homoserine lactone efflux protein
VDSQLIAYFVFTTMLVVTPGSTTAVVVRNVLDGGRRAGLAAAAGAALGNTSYATAAALGVAAVFARAPSAFTVLRAAGTVYLAALGMRSLWTAWRATPAALPGALERSGTGRAHVEVSSTRSGFCQGVVANLLNPAIATFYLTVVPAFLGGTPRPAVRFALLATFHITLAFVCHSAWALALDAMRAIWSRPAARRALETLTGLALLALALRLARG